MNIKLFFPVYLWAIFSLNIAATTDKDGLTLALDDIKVDENTLKYTGKGVSIAVIEGGFYLNHVWIINSISVGYNSVKDCEIIASDSSSYEEHTHGTHVIGTICASSLKPGRFGGLASDAEIIPILNDNSCYGREPGRVEKYLAAFQYAVDSEAKIINISQEVFCLFHIKEIIKNGVKRGKIFVVAAGNHGVSKTNNPNYNVDHSVIGSLAADEEIKPGFVVVGALSRDSGKTDHSYAKTGFQYARWSYKGGYAGSDYYSKNFSGNFIWAPGEDIYSSFAIKEGRSTTKEDSGTSMATPLVTSVLALLIEKYPDLTNQQIVEKLMSCPPSTSESERRRDIGNWPILDCSHLFADSE